MERRLQTLTQITVMAGHQGDPPNLPGQRHIQNVYALLPCVPPTNLRSKGPSKRNTPPDEGQDGATSFKVGSLCFG